MQNIRFELDDNIALVYRGIDYKNLLFEVPSSISTGSESLDALLSHGIEPLKLYMFYGPAGSGKTILLHQIAVNTVVLGNKAVYLDCEKSFNPTLVTRILKRYNAEHKISNILYKRIRYPGELEVLFNKLSNQGDLGVLLIDNFDQFLKLYLSNESRDPGTIYMLTRQILMRLHYLKEKKKIPIVITNRVYSNIDELISKAYLPYGGLAIRSMVNKSIHLMKEGSFIRAVDIYSNKPSSMFTIKNDGVYDL